MKKIDSVPDRPNKKRKGFSIRNEQINKAIKFNEQVDESKQIKEECFHTVCH